MDYEHFEVFVKAKAGEKVTVFTVSDKAIGGATATIQIHDVPGLKDNYLRIYIEDPKNNYLEVIFEREKAIPTTILFIKLEKGESITVTSGIDCSHILLKVTERFKEN